MLGTREPCNRRVLWLALRLGPGGVVTHMRALAHGLQQRGWNVALATQGQFGSHAHGPEWFENIGVRHFTTPFPTAQARIENVPRCWRTWRCLTRTVRVFRPDIIHVHWRVTSVFAQLLSFWAHIPFISTLHTSGTPTGWKHRALSYWGDRAIAVSAETRAELTDRFEVPAKRVRTIFYGADPAHFRPPSSEERHAARIELGLPRDSHVVAMIGTGWQRKGHDVLLRALHILSESGIRLTAVFAGDETERLELNTLIENSGVSDSVRFLGYRDTRSVLWASDVLALPSRKEGLPIVVIEAMLCGVVPVRTPTAGCRDQTHDGIDGFVIPFDCPEVLASRLRLLCDDESKRQAMSNAAIRSAQERFTSDRMADEICGVYEEVLRLPNRR